MCRARFGYVASIATWLWIQILISNLNRPISVLRFSRSSNERMSPSRMPYGSIAPPDLCDPSKESSNATLYRNDDRAYSSRYLGRRTYAERAADQDLHRQYKPSTSAGSHRSSSETQFRRKSGSGPGCPLQSMVVTQPTSTLRRRESVRDLRTRAYYASKPLPPLPSEQLVSQASTQYLNLLEDHKLNRKFLPHWREERKSRPQVQRV